MRGFRIPLQKHFIAPITHHVSPPHFIVSPPSITVKQPHLIFSHRLTATRHRRSPLNNRTSSSVTVSPPHVTVDHRLTTAPHRLTTAPLHLWVAFLLCTIVFHLCWLCLLFQALLFVSVPWSCTVFNPTTIASEVINTDDDFLKEPDTSHLAPFNPNYQHIGHVNQLQEHVISQLSPFNPNYQHNGHVNQFQEHGISQLSSFNPFYSQTINQGCFELLQLEHSHDLSRDVWQYVRLAHAIPLDSVLCNSSRSSSSYPDDWECLLHYLGCLLEDGSIWCDEAVNDPVHPPKFVNCKVSHLTDEQNVSTSSPCKMKHIQSISKELVSDLKMRRSWKNASPRHPQYRTPTLSSRHHQQSTPQPERCPSPINHPFQPTSQAPIIPTYF
ncbi:hypothetical protein RIF29_18536 [Crotalaria pallida]|uniref:Uncharacterized protein n=1 Tax=Crotalaria pallida TaxID=3830 RepID=A0AAN9FK17_CROPI